MVLMKTVLLLDDSPAFQRVVKLALLEVRQIRLLAASSEEVALKLISENTIDAIIAYSNFSGASTLGLLKKMKNYAPHLLVIAEQEADLKEFVQAGFSQALRKPLQGTELRKKVEQMLEISGEQEDSRGGSAPKVIPPPPMATKPPPPPPMREVPAAVATPIAAPFSSRAPTSAKSGATAEVTKEKEFSRSAPKSDVPRLTIDVSALKRSQDEISARGETGKAADELLMKLEKELRLKINDWLEKKMPSLVKETIQEEIDKVLS